MLPCRLIVDEPLDGALSMGLDESLLESVRETGVAVLRFYRWREPTLSLGYFQALADREGHLPSRGLPAVRRSTGGGALIHDHELTYCLALPTGSTPAGDAGDLYCAAHKALVQAVEDLGGDAPRLSTCIPLGRAAAAGIGGGGSGEPPAEPFLCFQRRARGDLLAAPGDGGSRSPVSDGLHKVCGSAQRKRPGVLLQHGGALLRRSAAAPELLGMEDLGVLDPSIGYEPLAQAWGERFAEGVGLALKHGHWSDTERSAGERLAAERFRVREWLAKR
jgi:lipoate-protein ligase A